MYCRKTSLCFLFGVLSAIALARSQPSEQDLGTAAAPSVQHRESSPQQVHPLTSEASQPQANQRVKKPIDGHLVRTGTVASPTEVGGVFLVGSLKCDGEGNLYVLSDIEGVSGIHKLNPKGERLAGFEARSNPDLKVDSALFFAVEANGGEVYQLVYPHQIDRFVFIYKADGTFKSAVKLQPGFAFFPGKLAVFASGQILVSGLEYDTDKAAVQWPFTGIFAADGRLLKKLELGDEKDLHDLAASGDARFALPGQVKGNRAVTNSQIEMADDGNAYVMRGTNPAILYAISPGGEVVRQFIVDPGESASAYRPSAMHIYKNRIALLFVEPQTNEKIMKIVDLEGHDLATYDEPAPDTKKEKYRLGATFACYAENPTRFTFLGMSDDGKIQIETAEPR